MKWKLYVVLLNLFILFLFKSTILRFYSISLSLLFCFVCCYLQVVNYFNCYDKRQIPYLNIFYLITYFESKFSHY